MSHSASPLSPALFVKAVSRRRGLRLGSAVGAVLVAGLAAQSVMAQTLPGTPTTVQQSTATVPTVGTSGNVETINLQGNGRTILTWGSGYTISGGGEVDYIFANKNDIVLNKVTGAASIDGILNGCLGTCTGSNYGGNVWIYSDTGVVFGANAAVNVGGLLATTSPMSTSDATFLASSGSATYNFGSGSGTGYININNGATITGHGTSPIAFVAPIITSDAGSSVSTDAGKAAVLYGAANAYNISFADDGSDFSLVSFVVPAYTDGSGSATPITLNGTTSAGNVYISSVNNAVDALISTTGQITATSATSVGGNIVLSADGDIVSGAATHVTTDGPHLTSVSTGPMSTGTADGSIYITAVPGVTVTDNLTSAAITLQSTGDVVNQTGGIITTASLTVNSVNDTTLNKANKIDNVTGGSSFGNFSLTNDKTLTATNISSVHNTTIKTTTGDLTVNGVSASDSAAIVTLTSAGALTLQGTDSAHSFVLGSAGNIAQTSGTIAADTLTANATGSGFTVALTQTGNAIGTLGSSSADSDFAVKNTAQTLNTSGTISSATGNVTLTTATSGNIAVGGNITLGTSGSPTSGKTLTLTSAGNISQSAGAVTADTLSASVGAGNGVSLTGANDIAHVATLTADGNIAINNSGHDLALSGDVTSSTGNVTLSTATSGDVNLAHNVSANGGTGTITLNAGGKVNQTAGTLSGTVGGTSGSDYTLSQANLALGDIISTGGNVSLTTTTGGLALANITATSGNTALSSAGAITQNGGTAIQTGTLSGSSTGATTLDSSTNQIAAVNGFTAGTSFTLDDAPTAGLSLTKVMASSGALSVTTTGTHGAISTSGTGANASSATTTIGLNSSGNIALGGDLTDTGTTTTLTSGGNITQSAGIVTAPTLTATASSGSIALNDANVITTLAGSSASSGLSVNSDHDLATSGTTASTSGTLKLTTTAGHDLTINGTATDTVAMDFEAGQNLTLDAIIPTTTATLKAGTGNISQTGGVIDANTLTADATGTGSTIDLTQTNNAIGTLGTSSADGDIAVKNTGQSLNISGTVSSANGNIALTTVTSGNIAVAGNITLGTSGTPTSGKTLTLTSAGNIHQSAGTITADTLSASVGAGNGVSLTGANDIAHVAALTADTAILINNTGHDLALSGDVTSTTGNVTLSTTTSGDVNLAHNVSANGGTGTITLNAGGKVNQTAGTLSGTVGGTSGSDFTLSQANLALSDITSTGGNVSLTTTTGGLSLANITATSGNTALSSATTISQTGGTAIQTGTLSGSSTGATTLDSSTNQIAAVNGFTAGTSFTLDDAPTAGLSLTKVVASNGALSVTTTGTHAAISTSGTGANASSATTTIGLNASGNIALGGDLTDTGTTTTLTSGGNITQSAGIVTAPTLTATASSGSIALNNANVITTLAGSSASSGLSVNSDHDLATSGTTASTSGTLKLTTTAGHDLTVNGTVTDTSAMDFEAGQNLTLGTAISTGAFTLKAGTGAIAQTANTDTVTAATLTGASGTTTVLNGNNHIAAVNDFTAGTGFTLNDAPTAGLGLSHVNVTTGDLSVTTTGSHGDITLTGTGASGSGASTTASLISSGAINLQGDLTSSTVNLTANNGSIIQTAGILTATVALNASAPGAGHQILLPDANVIGGLGTPLIATGNVNLTVDHNFTLTNDVTSTGGNVTIDVAGTLDIGSQTVSATTGSVSVTTTGTGNGMTLGNINATNTGQSVNLSSAGTITQATGTVIDTPLLTGSASGAVTLTNANTIGTLGAFSAPSLAFTNATGFIADGTSGGINGGSNLALTATTGDITLQGAIAGTATTLTASSGNITQASGSGNVITATTLNGSSSAATNLNGANMVGAVNGFTAGTDFALNDGESVSLTNVHATTGALSVTTTTGDITVLGTGANKESAATNVNLHARGGINITGNLDPADVTLTADTGDVAGAGVITANNLQATATAGAINLTGANLVITLKNSSAHTGLTFNNAQALTATNDQAGGALSITVAGALTANGGISGTSVNLSGTSLGLSDAINAGTGTATLTASSDSIVQAAGSGNVITAGTLTGSSATTTSLLGNNAIGALAAFTAGASFALNNTQALDVTGTVTASNGDLGLTTTSGDLTLDGNLATSTAGKTTTLTVAGAVTENGSHGISTGTLTGSSGAATSLLGNNTIGTLASYTAGTSLALKDSQALSVTGPVTASNGNLALTTTSGDLTLNGNLATSAAGKTTTLTAAGAVNQTGGTISTGTVAGSSGGATSLMQSSNSFANLAGYAAGTSLDVTDSTDLTATNVVASNGELTINDTGALGLNGVSATTNATLQSSGDLTLAGNVTAPTTSLTSTGGAINQSSGSVLTATTLSGSSSGATSLSGANKIGTLSNFTGGTGLAVNDTQALTATNDKATTGALSLTTTSGNLAATTVSGDTVTLSTASGTLNASGVTATNSATLQSSGDLTLAGNVTGPTTSLTSTGGAITQSSGSVLTATTLSGSSSGATSLTGANKIGTLSNFTGGTGLAVNDTQALTATNDKATTGALSLTTTSGNLAATTISGDTVTLSTASGTLNASGVTATTSATLQSTGDLTLAGNVTAPTTSLTSTGGSINQLSGLIKAASLSASAGVAITLNQANQITAITGLTANGGDIGLTDAVALNGTNIKSTTGAVTVTTTGTTSLTGITAAKAVTVSTTGDLAANTVSGASAALTASGALTTGGVTATSTAALKSGTAMTLNGSVTAPTSVTLTSGGGVNQTAGGITTAALGGTVNGGAATLAGANMIDTLTGLAASGDLTLSNGKSISVHDENVGGSLSVTTTAGDITASALNEPGSLTLTAAGALKASGTLTATGSNIALKTTTGDITINGKVDSTTHDTTMTSGGALSVSATSTLNGKNITLTASKDDLPTTYALQLEGLMTATDTVSLNATAGSIVIGDDAFVAALKARSSLDHLNISQQTPPLPLSTAVWITANNLKVNGNGAILQQLPLTSPTNTKAFDGGLKIANSLEIDGKATDIDLFLALGPQPLIGGDVALSGLLVLTSTPSNDYRVNSCVIKLVGVCTVVGTTIPNINPEAILDPLILKSEPAIVEGDPTVTGAGNEEIWRKKSK